MLCLVWLLKTFDFHKHCFFESLCSLNQCLPCEPSLRLLFGIVQFNLLFGLALAQYLLLLFKHILIPFLLCYLLIPDWMYVYIWAEAYLHCFLCSITHFGQL